MNNVISTFIDKSNLYVIIEVKTKGYLKVLFAVFILVVISMFIGIISSLKGNEVGSFLIPITLTFAMLFYWPFKTVIWNLGGKETIILNEKSVSYFKNYLFFQTNMETHLYKKLLIGLNNSKSNSLETNQKLGYLSLSEIREENGLEFLFYTSNIRISTEQYLQIISNFDSLITEFESSGSNRIILN